jgi:eukaryotic-like serine/threonine-protein kinase
MIGKTVSHFRVLARIGEGGMGVVYKAEDQRLRRPVALKVLPPGLVRDEERRLRFLREARAAASVTHSNIAVIHEVGEAEGIVYIAMELVEGGTLASAIAGRPLPIRDALRFAIEIAEGLARAHQVPVIHRDLKPDNIAVGADGHIKILDFGLAKLLEDPQESDSPEVSRLRTYSGEMTRAGKILGTASYMSPEQARGEPLDARSDLHSFGAVLYEMVTGRQAFPGPAPAVVFDAILNRTPPAPRTLNPDLPPELDRIIAKALEKDRELRYQSAAELGADLKRLKRDTEPVRAAATTPGTRPVRHTYRRIGGVAALLIALAGSIGWWAIRRARRMPGSTGPTTVAVLPFRNLGPDRMEDFLGLALPDEIVTTLSYARSLAIRPFASTQKYATGVTDPQTAGRELRVAAVVTGHYLREGDHLRVTMEAIDVESNRLLWRDTVSAKAEDILSMERQMTAQVRQGLVPRLGASVARQEAGAPPGNAKAYDLFLRGVALARDPAPNKEAIRMLERSVALDADYAPAWAALGSRYYFDGQYGDGGEAALDRAEAAHRRAVGLDPDLTPAASSLVVLQTERGDLPAAYDAAEDLVGRRPDSAEAHFALSYVFRYAGLLEESARECETGLALDPGDQGLRSCSITFSALGKYDRAMDFIRLDAGSEWASLQTLNVLLRQGRPREALQYLQALPGDPFWGPARIKACLENRTPSGLARLSGEPIERALAARRDGEPKYYIGAQLAYCGEIQAASGLIRQAIEQNHCSYPLVDTDPLLEKLRSSPDFPSIRSSAIDCQRRFLEHRARRRP